MSLPIGVALPEDDLIFEVALPVPRVNSADI
jgi:hypothetical protein